ncbi:MAG: hypothetical protein HUN04_04190 [Desulfobacter sp.]|nr:MAG: hypothetical protein HUN04_04190 [Desulfobacter sp.]
MFDIAIPKPFIVTVDDVGWWNGRDGSAQNQPFRTGMPRSHVPEDYKALAALGKGLGMRIPVGFVLCEWDRTNLLRALPSATWMGSRWQAPVIDQAQREKAASIIKEAAPFLEPALHGVGHEFWMDGKLDRSEFHTNDGKMRHPDEVKMHLEYFFRLLHQNRLDTDVKLFIPPALNHSFGNGESGFQKIAASFGIRQVSLVFDRARCHAQPQFREVGWENKVVLMDRGPSPIAWNRVAPAPDFNPDQPILPLHWANILHESPGNNMAVINAWIKAINRKLRKKNLLPARDIRQCLTQHLHCTRSRVERQGAHLTVHMDWIHQIPGESLGDSVFFSVTHGPQSKIQIYGTEKMPQANPGQARFLRLGLPVSGKIVFRVSTPDI